MKKLPVKKETKAKKPSVVKKAAPKKAAPKKAAPKKTAVKKVKAEISESQKLARELAVLTLSKKAVDVKILDLRGLTTIADFFIVCTGGSDTQVKAIADAVVEGAKAIGERPWHKEGLALRNWVLLDYVDVVVHVFLKDTREFYSLEKLWGDAPIEEVSE